MPISVTKRLKQETLFNFMKSTFFTAYQSMLDQGIITNDKLLFEIFKDQADYDGTILVPMYADEDDAQKINYGLFRFIGGEVDPSELFSVYFKRFTFEMLAFDEYRQDIISLFNNYASSLDGNSFILEDDQATSRAFFQVNEFPDMTQTIDANGADKFIISITIDILIYNDIVHSKETSLRLNGTEVSFSEVVFGRNMIEPGSDLKKSYQMEFVPSRSTFSINVTGYYTSDDASSSVIDWIMDETKLSEPMRLYYNDGFKLKTGVYMVAESRLSVPFESISAWSLSLIPYRGQEQQFYGVLAKGANIGNGEYQPQQVVTISADATKSGMVFNSWSIEYSSDPSFTIDDLGDSASSTTTFPMPNGNLILRANYIPQEG
jgi:hypothetical protein